MAPPKYLDDPCSELMAGRHDIHFFCACGRDVRFGPEDFARWPNSSLHRIAARLKCNGCGTVGDIPELRLTATSTRGHQPDAGAGPHCQMVETAERTEITPTTHPRRSRRNGSGGWAKLLKQPKLLTCNAAKNTLMPRARDLARTGRYPRWLDVVLQFDEEGQYVLRTWLTDDDKDELEMLHQACRRYAQRSPPCCPAGAFRAH